MKDASRLVRKLRRKVYREVPIATWNRAAEVDWRGSYDSLISTFRRGDCGALSGGAALALWRAATDAGFRAWCYDFGFPESLTHMVTVVELDGRLRVHDPFLNLGYRADFYEILEGLRADQLPDIRCETRDRKIYVVDPSCESQLTIDWLTAHADRELDRVGSLRRFEVLWDTDALRATLARPEAVYRDLETRGYPADLSYLMLHPIGVFDGGAHHQNPETMPLIGGRDLRSPVAGLRAAMRQLTQDLAVERDQLAAKSTISGQLEGELAEARSQLLAASGEADQLSAQSAQLRIALDDSSRQWDAERQALSQGNFALEERRTALEVEFAEVTTRHTAAADEARRLADQVVQLRAALDETTQRSGTERDALGREKEWLEVRRTALETDLAEARSQLLAVSEEVEQLSAEAAQLRAAFDDARQQWAAERQTLSQENLALQAAVQALGEESGKAFAASAAAQLRAEKAEAQAFAASAAAQLRAEKAEAQAKWADFHVAELVEKEAVAASELVQRRDEVAALVFGIKRLLSIDDLPGNDLPTAVARLREHFRTLERELDQAEAERDRLRAALQERTTRQSRAAGRVRRYIRRLFQRADHHGNFIAMRG